MPKWRNWYTRRSQKPVGATPWEFDPLLRHHYRGIFESVLSSFGDDSEMSLTFWKMDFIPVLHLGQQRSRWFCPSDQCDFTCRSWCVSFRSRRLPEKDAKTVPLRPIADIPHWDFECWDFIARPDRDLKIDLFSPSLSGWVDREGLKDRLSRLGLVQDHFKSHLTAFYCNFRHDRPPDRKETVFKTKMRKNGGCVKRKG